MHPKEQSLGRLHSGRLLRRHCRFDRCRCHHKPHLRSRHVIHTSLLHFLPKVTTAEENRSILCLCDWCIVSFFCFFLEGGSSQAPTYSVFLKRFLNLHIETNENLSFLLLPSSVPVSRASCAPLQVSILLANKISASHTFLSYFGRMYPPSFASPNPNPNNSAVLRTKHFLIKTFSDAELASGIVCGCMPALVPFISHFGPKIQRSFSYFPSLRSYFSSSYYNRRSGGVIGTASSGTTGPSLPGGTDRKSNSQSWGNKVKVKSDYLELTELSSYTVTITDDNERDERDGRDGRVHIKDLESGLQQRTNKVVPPAQDVDSPLQWNPASVRHAEIESKPPNKVPAQDVDSQLQWSPVSDRPSSVVVIGSNPPNKVPAQDVDSQLQWSPVSDRPSSVVVIGSNPPNKVPAQDVDSQFQWSPVSDRPSVVVIGSNPPNKHIESRLQWNPVTVGHPEIESPPPAIKGRRPQSQSPTHHVESEMQSNPAPPARHPEIELQHHMTRRDHRSPQLPVKHIDSPLRMHPPPPR